MQISGTVETIQVILGLIAGAALYILHSPLGSGLDKRTTAVLTFLSCGKLQTAYNTATNLTESPDARRLAATSFLVQETKGSQLPLTSAQANAALDWILKEYHEGQTLLANPKQAIPSIGNVVTEIETTVDPTPATTEGGVTV
jgi:hypothetical protein